MSAREGRELLVCSRPVDRAAGATMRTEMTKRSQIEKRNAFNARSQNGGQGQRTDEREGKMTKRNQNGKAP
jgi:hypothetical protein